MVGEPPIEIPLKQLEIVLFWIMGLEDDERYIIFIPTVPSLIKFP
jgi:hypothetical protein